jgi:hypothetical protein
MGRKPAGGVYKGGNTTRQVYKVYEKYKDLVKGTGMGNAVDQATIEKIKQETGSLWAKTGGPGSHMAGQALDVGLGAGSHEEMKSKVEKVKQSNPKFKNYNVHVKYESDHYHLGIKPG